MDEALQLLMELVLWFISLQTHPLTRNSFSHLSKYFPFLNLNTITNKQTWIDGLIDRQTHMHIHTQMTKTTIIICTIHRHHYFWCNENNEGIVHDDMGINNVNNIVKELLCKFLRITTNCKISCCQGRMVALNLCAYSQTSLDSMVHVVYRIVQIFGGGTLVNIPSETFGE